MCFGGALSDGSFLEANIRISGICSFANKYSTLNKSHARLHPKKLYLKLQKIFLTPQIKTIFFSSSSSSFLLFPKEFFFSLFNSKNYSSRKWRRSFLDMSCYMIIIITSVTQFHVSFNNVVVVSDLVYSRHFFIGGKNTLTIFRNTRRSDATSFKIYLFWMRKLRICRSRQLSSPMMIIHS